MQCRTPFQHHAQYYNIIGLNPTKVRNATWVLLQYSYGLEAVYGSIENKNSKQRTQRLKAVIPASVSAEGKAWPLDTLFSNQFCLQWNLWSPNIIKNSEGSGVQPLKQAGFDVLDGDVAQLSPFIHERHINLLGCYSLAIPEAVIRGELRPLRNPNDKDA